MIHYTPLPLDDVFAGWDEERPRPQEVTVDGVTMLVEPINSREAKIVRIISSNPEDFMKAKFQPGEKVAFFPSPR